MNLNINLISPALSWLSQVLLSPHLIMEYQEGGSFSFGVEEWGGGFLLSLKLISNIQTLVMSEYL